MKRGNAGNTIIIALSAMTTLAALVGVATAVTQHQARITQRNRVQATAIEIADGSLEMLFSGWRKIISTAPVTDPPTSLPSANFDTEIPLPPASYFPDVPAFRATRANDTSFTLSNYKVEAVNPLLEKEDLKGNVYTASTQPDKGTGPGSGTTSFFYLASADVTLPVISGKPLTAKVRRVFEKRVTSPWNWAVFFQDDLEVQPNSPLTLNGWVHTNGDLYTGSSKLTVTDRMTYQGDWSIGYAPGDAIHAAQTPTAPVSPADYPPGHDSNYVPFGWYINDIVNTGDLNANNDGYHELIEKPAIGVDAFADKRFYNQASIRIEIDALNNVTIRDASGNLCSPSDNSNSSKGYAYETFKKGAAIKPNYSFQDNREAATVRVVDVDVAAIRSRYATSTYKGFNGVIHITDTSANPTLGVKRGIRLVNAQQLPSGGLTIVSENPVYIKGNFNTGGDNPPSNSGDATKPTESGYTRQPAAIICDAVTLLSKDFSDTNSGGNLSNRPAQNTTVNAVIVAGNVPTGTNGSDYSGGLENFVRLLEDWTGKTFTYYGSLVQLYQSSQGTGAWGNGNVYKPGNLNWNFDDKFLSVSPPGTLTTVSYLQQQRWFVVY